METSVVETASHRLAAMMTITSVRLVVAVVLGAQASEFLAVTVRMADLASTLQYLE
jgi:hypothetical protein